MTEKKVIRKKKKVNYRRRRRLFFLALIALIFLAIFGIRSAFSIEQIHVQGLSRMDDATIQQITGNLIGESYYSLETRRVIDEIDELPYTREVEKSFSFPGTLNIKITEERPVATILGKNTNILINEDLKLLEETATFDQNLPRISGLSLQGQTMGSSLKVAGSNEGFDKLLQSLFHSKMYSEINTISRLQQGLEIHTKSNIKILIRSFRDGSLKVKELEKIYDELMKSNESFSTILLDYGDNPIAIRSDATEEMIYKTYNIEPEELKKRDTQESEGEVGEDDQENSSPAEDQSE